MIRFRCHRCKRPLAVPEEGFVGKKVKCPGCSIVTIVPDIPGAREAKARTEAAAAPKEEVTYLEAPEVIDDPLADLAQAADASEASEDDHRDAGDDAPRPSRRRGREPRAAVDRSGGGGKIAMGAILFIGGIVISVVSYQNAAEGGTYVVASGAILWGLITMIGGMIDAAKS